MPCNGWNHEPGCECGWGGTGYGGGGGYGGRVPSTRDMSRLLWGHGGFQAQSSEALTHPMSCPRCGAEIFFHTNGHGDIVFFDDLGPPWPKHACFDDPANTRVFAASSQFYELCQAPTRAWCVSRNEPFTGKSLATSGRKMPLRPGVVCGLVVDTERVAGSVWDATGVERVQYARLLTITGRSRRWGVQVCAPASLTLGAEGLILLAPVEAGVLGRVPVLYTTSFAFGLHSQNRIERCRRCGRSALYVPANGSPPLVCPACGVAGPNRDSSGAGSEDRGGR